MEASPLGKACTGSLTNAYADITGIGIGQCRIVCSCNRYSTGNIPVECKFRTGKIYCACRIGFGDADITAAGTVGGPVATQVVEGITAVFFCGIHFSLNSVDKAGTKQVGRTVGSPDGCAMGGIVGTAKHELADHGIAGALFPGALTEACITFACRSVGSLQPVIIGTAVGSHVTDGIDSACTVQVFRTDPRPDDGRDQYISVLGNA